MLARLWLRSQEMPEQWALSLGEHRDQRLEAAQTALRPTWDLRLVPAALSAWGASLLGTAQAGEVGAALSTVLGTELGASVVVALAVLVVVALLARRGGRRPSRAEYRTARSRRLASALPTLVLCAVVAACVLLRVGVQQLAAAEDVSALGDQPQRLVVEVADRPVTWHSATSSRFGPGPEELGEASSGVVVPVLLENGAQATVFAQDDRWASLRSGERVEAVLSAPQLEQTDLQLRSTGPPQPVPQEQHRPSLLERATHELAAAQNQMLLLGRKTALERIATFLLDLPGHDPARVAEPGHVHLPMTRSEIADYLGLTIETVSLVLTKLKTGADVLMAMPADQF